MIKTKLGCEIGGRLRKFAKNSQPRNFTTVRIFYLFIFLNNNNKTIFFFIFFEDQNFFFEIYI